MNPIDVKEWFVLRVPYGREYKLKQYLDTVNIESFLPMQHRTIEQKGVKKCVLVPVIKNLIFIYDTRKSIQSIKLQCEKNLPFRYIMDYSTSLPMVVDNREMENFIAVAGTYDEQLIYLTQVKPDLLQGDKVRVIDGNFIGVEGRIVRIKKNRRVMVSLSCGIGVATGFIHPNLLEKI